MYAVIPVSRLKSWLDQFSVNNWLTASQATKLLHVHRQRVQQLAKTGQIVCHHFDAFTTLYYAPSLIEYRKAHPLGKRGPGRKAYKSRQK